MDSVGTARQRLRSHSSAACARDLEHQRSGENAGELSLASRRRGYYQSAAAFADSFSTIWHKFRSAISNENPMKIQNFGISSILSAFLISALLIIVFSGTGAFGIQDNKNPTAADLRYKAPAEWSTERPSSSMRVAQYKLPKAEGDPEDASLVLYFFGANSGGSVQANLDRWISQIEQPDGSPSTSKAKTETLDINSLKATTIDLAGTYVAETAPGSGTRHNKPGYRLRAAVIETPKGAFYVKLVGPAKTIDHWDKTFVSYLRSFEFK